MSPFTDLFSSLYRFSDLLPDQRKSMATLWYVNSCVDLALAIKNMPGQKLFVNSSSIKSIENSLNKLFLLSDVVAVRDTRKFIDNGEPGGVLEISEFPHDWQPYDRVEFLQHCKEPPPPIIRKMFSHRLASSSMTMVPALNCTVPRSLLISDQFHDDVYEWIFGSGRQFLESGQVVYAPFIPPIEVELEFIKNKLSVMDMYGGQSLFVEDFDFLDESSLLALASLKLPTFENIPLPLLGKIKIDNQDEFGNFSRAILKAVGSIKSSAGSESFVKEVRSIQRDIIDDNVQKIRRKYEQIAKMRSLSAGGVFVGTIGIGLSMIEGAAIPAITTGLAGAVTASIAHTAALIKERYGLCDNPMHFLWRVQRAAE